MGPSNRPSRDPQPGRSIRLALAAAVLVASGLGLLPAGASAATSGVFADAGALNGYTSSTDAPRPWNRYPAVVPVSGLEGTITKATVTFNDWTAGATDYTDAALVSPTGVTVKLISDAGTYVAGTQAADHVTVTFDQDAVSSAPPSEGPGSGPIGPKNGSVTLRPTDYVLYGADTFPSPAPAGLGAALPSLTPLVGTAPNGTWSLYVVSRYSAGAFQSFVNGGWSLSLTTTGPPPPVVVDTAVLPPVAPQVADVVAPAITRVATDSASFRAEKKGEPVGPRGAVLGFRSSEAGTVSFDVARLLPGRTTKKGCRSQTAANRKAKRCTQVKAVPGTFVLNAVAGDNTFRFTGRLSGRTLKPGSYRLTGTAKDAAGNTAPPFTFDVRVKASIKKKG